MCGIVGIFSKSASLKPSMLTPSLDRLRHRGPDDEGCLLFNAQTRKAATFGGDDTPAGLGLRHWRDAGDESGHVLLGHRRLSILDLSPRGHQPMSSADGACWIVFNGEIYNYIELREELRGLGHEFHTGTDTEVILHAWQQWGKDCLARFNGDWAFGILDTRATEPILFLARDRFGVKPLYFTENDDAVWFASEAKALVGHAVPFRPREHAIVRFLFGGELPAGDGDETFFEGVFQLPPGQALTIRRDGVERLWWYDLSGETKHRHITTESKAAADIASRVDSAVKLRLRADVPVGSCLSGGVDSSSIVGTMRALLDTKEGGGELHTFSAVYRETGNFNEEQWIEQVVAHTRCTAHYVRPDEAALAGEFDRMVWHQDEPFQTASIFAQWCVMREARRQGVTVLLDGQAADEIFAGYQPGTYQEHLLELVQTGRFGRFFRAGLARRSATRLPWSVLIRELFEILVHGATGMLRTDPMQFDLDTLIRRTALRDDIAARFFPRQPLPDLKNLDAEKRATDEKLAEHRRKLAKWRKKKSSLEKNPQGHEDELQRLDERIAEKRQHIESNERKLKTLGSQSKAARRNLAARSGGFTGRMSNLPGDLKKAWQRIQGEPRHNLRDYLLRQVVGTALQHLLRFEDRNSMAFSVEARVPFTDHELVEQAFTAADDFKIHRGWTKWVLREAMEGRAPESILWRRDKTGFETPDVTMTRRLLEHRGIHPAKSEFLCRYLNAEIMRETCRRLEDKAATREDARLVWRWLVLDSWHTQFGNAAQSFVRVAPVFRTIPPVNEGAPGAAAATPSPPDSGAPLPNSATAGGRGTSICIVVFGFVGGDARVQREARALAKNHDVTVAGFGVNPFAGNADAIRWRELRINDPDRLIPLRKQWLRLRLARFFPSLLETYMLEFVHFRDAWNMIRSGGFDLVYCNDVDTLLVGVAAKRQNPSTRILLDLHEHPTREMDAGSGATSHHWLTVRKPLVSGIMKHFSRLADGTVTVTESFVPLFAQEFPMKKPVVIHNAPAFVGLPPRGASRGDTVRLVHHGSCSPPRRQELMIRMMAWLDDRFTLDLMLVGNDPEYHAFLRNEAAKLRPGRVNFRPPVAPEEITKSIASYDIGVFLLPPVIFNFEHALPNKFFDYIAAGLGVAIGPTKPMAKITLEHGVGWVSEDFEPRTFAKMLNNLTAEDIAAKQSASRLLSRTLNAETEMSRLVSFVDQLLSDQAAPLP